MSGCLNHVADYGEGPQPVRRIAGRPRGSNVVERPVAWVGHFTAALSAARFRSARRASHVDVQGIGEDNRDALWMLGQTRSPGAAPEPL